MSELTLRPSKPSTQLWASRSPGEPSPTYLQTGPTFILSYIGGLTNSTCLNRHRKRRTSKSWHLPLAGFELIPSDHRGFPIAHTPQVPPLIPCCVCLPRHWPLHLHSSRAEPKSSRVDGKGVFRCL